MKEISKPWGRELWFAANDKYAGKIIEVDEGKRLSLQYHEKKHETMYLIDGLVRIIHNDKEVELKPGDSIEIKPGDRHRVRAVVRSRIVEVSTPELDDVVRLEDDYGR
jgi:mannose-6-phosphate isomerase-like protein (cupin superfamily)